MQIQINTDDNIEGREAFAGELEADIRAIFGRFGDEITRVEVHLSDENAAKAAGPDKRCLMEARPRGRQPVTASDQASTLKAAVAGAARKLRRSLDSTLGRASQHKGGASIREE